MSFRSACSCSVLSRPSFTMLCVNVDSTTGLPRKISSREKIYSFSANVRLQLGITTAFVYVCPPDPKAYTICKSIWRAYFAFKHHYRSIAVFPLSYFFFKGAFRSPIKALIHLTLRFVYRENGVLNFLLTPEPSVFSQIFTSVFPAKHAHNNRNPRFLG